MRSFICYLIWEHFKFFSRSQGTIIDFSSKLSDHKIQTMPYQGCVEK